MGDQSSDSEVEEERTGEAIPSGSDESDSDVDAEVRTCINTQFLDYYASSSHHFQRLTTEYSVIVFVGYIMD